MRFIAAILLLCITGILRASEVIPAVPVRFFNDYAHVVSPEVANSLNRQLAEFERSTSSQIVVAIYPTMQTDSSIEDYTQRIFTAWKPGQKNLNNGAVLLVFMKERKMRIQTGYGLEGALPDALCKRIIDDEIAPRFRVKDYNGGMEAGVHAMIQAAKGEYKGTGRTVYQQQQQQQHHRKGGNSSGGWIFPLIFFIIFIILGLRSRSRGTFLNSGGSRTFTSWGPGFGGGGWSSGGGGWSSGGGDSGGFSGGGGDSGGGGANGDW